MLSHERAARNSASHADYAPLSVKQRLPVREAILLARYHLRLLNWWLFCLMVLGFLGACALLWLELRPGGPMSLGHAISLSQFVLESGAGLVAGMLTSSLIVGDPVLEVTMTTRAGIYRVLLWRYLLTLCILLLCSTLYLTWSLWNGVSYAVQQNALFILLVWLAPVLVMSMLGLLGSLITRNAALGAVIAAIPLMAAIFMHDILLAIPAIHPFFIPYTYWGHDAPDWWTNRLALLGVALALAAWTWYWLRREERLLGNLH
jgi:hypothetical protein